MILYLFFLIQAGKVLTHTSSFEALILGFFIPLVISSFMMGFTVYQQHTHESIPWFLSRNERDHYVKIEEITMHVKFPHWYNVISHNTMAHTAHHVDSRIPLYNLSKAQEVLNNLLGDELTTINFSLKDFLGTMRKCKLYDYDNHLWLGFDGLPSSEISLIDRGKDIEIEYTQAA
jgi:omega-6 fatty acid desaturase (delta-12 desaturase)